MFAKNTVSSNRDIAQLGLDGATSFLATYLSCSLAHHRARIAVRTYHRPLTFQGLKTASAAMRSIASNSNSPLASTFSSSIAKVFYLLVLEFVELLRHTISQQSCFPVLKQSRSFQGHESHNKSSFEVVQPCHQSDVGPAGRVVERRAPAKCLF